MIELKGKYTGAKIFTDLVDETAIGQIIQIINHKICEGTKVRFMPDCLTEDTEVLTVNGFKLIKELKKDDVIAEYDESTGDIVWAAPKSIIVRELRQGEKVFSIKNNQHNIQIDTTENHRNAIVDKMGIKTKDIQDHVKIKELIWNGNTKSKGLKINDDMLRLISWIIADGNIKVTKNQKSVNYRIRMGAKKQRKIKEMSLLIEKMELEHAVRVCPQRGTEFTLNTAASKPILEILNYKKEFPSEWITLLNASQIKLLIEEYIKSDGDYENYLSRGSIGIGSSNKETVDFFSAITSLGYGSSYIRERMSSESSFKPGKIYYYISIVPNSKLKSSLSGYPNKKLIREEIEYSNDVVCLETNTGYFIARQKGRAFVTGNCHAGKGSTIGTTIALPKHFEDWKVCPNVVGVDVGCAIMMYKLSDKEVNLEELDDIVNEIVPAGFSVHQKAQNVELTRAMIDNLTFNLKERTVDRIHNSLGTLGGGNHFIELGKDENGNYWLSVHSGSRGLGVQVATYHQNVAIDNLRKNKIALDDVIDKLKSEGRHSEIQKTIELLKKETPIITKSDETLAYLENESLLNYFSDMKIAQEYAHHSRKIMLDNIVNSMGFTVVDEFDSVHNFIEIEFEDNKPAKGIIRKGATSAKLGERLVIPLNMRDGSIIAVGKGNQDWNNSAPHGAGRMMSRTQARRELNLEDFRKQMDGIHSSSIGESTIDEAPGAYKPADEILSRIKDTVEILHIVKPVYNFKAK